MKMFAVSALVCCLACVVAPAWADGSVASWRGPGGYGVFPAGDIVTACDEAKGQNVVWKTPLPFIGCNSPVYVAGKVFVLCDAGWKSDAPVLLCVDARDGKVLWQQTVDNLDARPADEAAWARAQRAREYAMARRARELLYQHGRATDDAARKAIEETATKEGFAIRADKGKFQLSLTSCKRVFTPPHARGQDYKRLEKEGLFYWEGWYYAGTIYTGATFPSVVSDGECVYAYTNNAAAACFDLAGQRKWIVDLRMPAGGHGSGPITTASPTLVGDTIILFKYDMAVALDKRTGRELWRHKCGYTGAYTRPPASFAASPASAARWAAGSGT